MRYFLIIFLFFYSTPVFASGNVFIQHPYYRNIHSPYHNNYSMRENRLRRSYNPNISYYQRDNNELNQLERYLFDRNYYRESELSRLERMERQTFGTVQQGDFDTRYENVKTAILSRPRVTDYQKPSIVKSVADYFSGQLTGFTPSLENDLPSSFDYGNRNYIINSSPWGNKYMYNQYGSGSSSGIRILD